MTELDPSTPGTPLDETMMLVRQAQHGDRTALNRALERIRPQLERWIASRLGPKIRSRLDVEDVLQEVLFAAWRSIGDSSFQSAGQFHAWVFKIAQNRIRDAADFVSAKRRSPEREAMLVRTLAGSRTGPATLASRADDRDRILDALASLSDTDREVIRLVRLEGMSNSAAAEMLGIKENALAVRLYRAIRNLGKRLEALTRSEIV